MKKAARLFASILILAALLSCFSIVTFAISDHTESRSNGNARGILDDFYLEGGGAHHRYYGYAGWSSLSATQSYYGTDLSYHSCSVHYNGNYYNYYYTFSDGDIMCFGVKG